MDLVRLGVVFVLAFSLRAVAAFQYTAAPDFDNPIGDSMIYVERARSILSGDLLGEGVDFHSSPLYPYFIALVFAMTDGSFLALRLVQAAIGSLGCVVIALLARRLTGGDRGAEVGAGLAAAGYGTLAFFDIDLMMISQTIFLVSSCLLLLLRGQPSGSPLAALGAGAALGLAASDKPNLLLFAPVAAWYLAGTLSLRPERWRWRPAAVFVVATAAVILPITLRNLVVGRDLVLVSSNGGVNLYIGNNPWARGTFFLPAESGLQNVDLQGSSTAVAERALGRTLKPSEVSRYWAARAWRFILADPLGEATPIGLKLRRLVSAYEVPNHLNVDYIKTEYIPVLRWVAVGAWLIFPLAIAGIGWRWARGAGAADRLLCGYLAAYSVSLLPFFITDRYRLPLVPVLIVYACALVSGLARDRAALSRPGGIALILGLGAAAAVVHWPIERFDYAFDRVAMAIKYYERSRREPAAHWRDLEQAIVQLKWAVETAPDSADAHYNLGVVLESVGFYSGAAAEFSQTLQLQPDRALAAVALRGVREKLARRGDRTGAAALPSTPFEQARAAELSGRGGLAEQLYGELLLRDPFHVPASERVRALHTRARAAP